MQYSVNQLIAIALFFIISLFSPYSISAQGFLSVNGKSIVDAEGNEVILRGHSPGGWMLQEGYMLQMEAFANPQHQIRAKIEELIGPEQTGLFYEKWLENHFTRADFDLLVDMGFNSIRLPMHYNLFTLPIEDEPVEGENTWLEKGFAMVDTLLAWCTEHEIYLILDMHATPGGQGKDAAISDYDSSKLSLWESEQNRDKLVALWRKLAQRYSDETWIGGYDLINEPNWAFTGNNINGCDESTNVPLRNLYERITEAIREVDTNHIIFIEGNCWGNNHNGLTPPWDDKLVYSFHKYWSSNDPGSIQWMINLRNTHNVPIWCGESGENSNHWYTDAVRLFEENGIGWAWWTWKKFGSFSGIAAVQPPAGYQVLKNYWQNGGTQPTAEYATEVLMELAERLKLEHCIINYPVADALLRQPTEGTAIPFTQHTLPAIVFATDFDLGQNGVAYSDEVFQNTHVSSGNYTEWNTGWGYRNDGVDIETISDGDPSNGFNVGWTAAGEWIQYTVDVPETAGYSFSVRYGSTRSTTLRVKVNDQDLIAPLSMPSTGGWQSWQTFTVPDMILNAGVNAIRIFIESGGCNLNYFEFSNPVPVSETPFQALVAETLGLGDSIALVLNLKPDQASTLSASEFSMLVNNIPVTVSDVALLPGSRTVIIIPENRIYYNNNVKISYNGTSIVDELERPLEQFADLTVINKTPIRYNLPGTIQVENYYHQFGLSFEDTEDTGGGSNFGFTDPGDYADYFVKINQAGTYIFSYRVAALAGNGKFRIELYDDDNTMTQHGTFNVPTTGGWQTWQTVNSEISLPEGYYKLRVYIVSKEFNMNWFKVGSLITNIPDQGFNDLNIYPNPAIDRLTVAGSNLASGVNIQVFNVSGQKIHSDFLKGSNSATISVEGWPAGIYIVRLFAMGETRSIRLIISNYTMN